MNLSEYQNRQLEPGNDLQDFYIDYIVIPGHKAFTLQYESVDDVPCIGDIIHDPQPEVLGDLLVVGYAEYEPGLLNRIKHSNAIGAILLSGK